MRLVLLTVFVLWALIWKPPQRSPTDAIRGVKAISYFQIFLSTKKPMIFFISLEFFK